MLHQSMTAESGQRFGSIVIVLTSDALGLPYLASASIAASFRIGRSTTAKGSLRESFPSTKLISAPSIDARTSSGIERPASFDIASTYEVSTSLPSRIAEKYFSNPSESVYKGKSAITAFHK